MRVRAQAEDPTVRQGDWADALEQLLADWDSISVDQRAEVVDQVRDAIADEDLSALAALSADPQDAEDTLTAAMEDMAALAAETMSAEAAAQGVTVAAGTADAALLAAVAATAAAILAGGLALAAGAEALRVWRPGADPDDVADHVRQHLNGLSDAHLTERLGGALTMAQNHGRAATLQAAPTATYTASEANDINTCGPCADIDGTEFDDLDAALDVYGLGGYPGCLGRWRCRGTLEATWEAPT